MKRLGKDFPTELVKEITGTTQPEYHGMTVPCDLTPVQVRRLVEEAVIDLDDCFNCSPDVKGFLRLADSFPDKDIRYIAYVVYPPRPDARVTVEGFNITGLSMRECMKVVKDFRSADELDFDEDETGNFNVRVWYD